MLPEAPGFPAFPCANPLKTSGLFGPLTGASARDALRVQSISTWAMACIGPYSQAPSDRDRKKYNNRKNIMWFRGGDGGIWWI